jgi:hypothetical protein
MALANTACLLAEKCLQEVNPGPPEEPSSVLMVDWDLEAPGLHRFFPPSDEKSEQEGIIDLFGLLNEETLRFASTNPDERQEFAHRLLDRVNLRRFIRPADVADLPNLSIMESGQGRLDYVTRVNSFPWDSFYKRDPWLITLFAEALTRLFKYDLIDSRTGLTDVSGICTMILPEKLVAAFTPNEQSVGGILDLVKQAINYRCHSEDGRPLVVYPLPTRIDPTRQADKDKWRSGNAEGRFLGGYQPRFETAFRTMYGLGKCDLKRYFDEVQVQHAPEYAYGETIAVRRERSGDVLSLSKSYERFRDWLLRPFGPWESDADIAEGEQLAQRRARSNALAEDQYNRADAMQAPIIRRLALRLVKVGKSPVGDLQLQRSFLQMTDLDEATKAVALALVDNHLLSVSGSGPDKPSIIEFADEATIGGWSRLSQWIMEDKDFLLWRTQLGDAIALWAGGGRTNEFLLKSSQLREAKKWARTKTTDLTVLELDFIARSSRESRIRVWGQAFATTVLFVAVMLSALQGVRGRDQKRLDLMSSQLLTLRAAQDEFWKVNRTYAEPERFDQLSRWFSADTADVSVRLIPPSGGDYWAAKATHARMRGVSCVIFVGDVPKRPVTDLDKLEAERQGVPVCDAARIRF